MVARCDAFQPVPQKCITMIKEMKDQVFQAGRGRDRALGAGAARRVSCGSV